MKKINLFVFVLLSASVFSDTLLHVGNLIDVENGDITKAITITVSSNEIKSITKGYARATKNDTVIDLKNSFVLPGFMDMHVHLAQEYVPKAERPAKSEPEYRALFAANAATKTLMAGFTSVRNLGDGGMETIALREAISQGLIVGPRIFTSGKTIATTGGHGDPSNGKSKADYSHHLQKMGLLIALKKPLKL